MFHISAIFDIYAKEFVQIISLRDLNTDFFCLDSHFCPVLNKMNKTTETWWKKTPIQQTPPKAPQKSNIIPLRDSNIYMLQTEFTL